MLITLEANTRAKNIDYSTATKIGVLKSASFVTAYAALRPRDGFFHPHQEHMKYTYILFGSKQRLKDNPVWMSNVIESLSFVKYLRRTIDPCLSFESMANTIIKEANSPLIYQKYLSFHSRKLLVSFFIQSHRQWCGIIHYHWWTASIKPRLLFSRAGYASRGLSLSSV